jgi:hypothetical protein
MEGVERFAFKVIPLKQVLLFGQGEVGISSILLVLAFYLPSLQELKQEQAFLLPSSVVWAISLRPRCCCWHS